jgi:Uma2 family endonuclease
MTMIASERLPATRLPRRWTLADLQQHLGGIPLERIRLYPPPGLATEEHVVQLAAHEDRLYELEDGVLVEKAVGWYESLVAVLIVTELNKFLETNDLGQVLGADGTLRILPGIVKIPDVSFLSWSRFPKEGLSRRPIPSLVPDLAVEVLSETNTPQEMARKRKQYFRAGVRLVWQIDPAARTAEAYTSPADVCRVDENGTLDGGDVLPGFRLSLRDLFARADRRGPAE